MRSNSRKSYYPAVRQWLAPISAMLLLALSACATGPVYRAKASDGIGYSDQQITLTRYRVAFSGDVETSLPQVEDFLMRRAAEITMEAGYTHFVFDGRNTEAKTNLYTSPDSWNPEIGLGFNLGRRYANRMKHFSNWSIPAYWSASEAAPITRYTASSEIVLLSPDQAAKEPLALSAREILSRLAPAEIGKASPVRTGSALP